MCTQKLLPDPSVHLLAIWDSSVGKSTINRSEDANADIHLFVHRRVHGTLGWRVGRGRTPPDPTRPRPYAAEVAHPLDREIWRLALPAFLALIAEPLFLLADAAIVGHLGTTSLAGLGIAAVVLQTVIGLCVFLAYGTTAGVARLLGAGDRRAALAQGVDGVWLAVLIGVLVTVVGVASTDGLVGLFGADPAVTEAATTYLRIAFLGTTPLLVMLATTGILRGLQDTRTPLLVAVAGNGLNVALNLLLVFGIGSVPGLGIAGSALGSVIAQVASAAALLAVVVRAARAEGANLGPDRAGIRRAAHAGVPLVIRTVTLRAALLLTTYAVVLGADPGRDQSVSLATHQLALTIWTFLAFALDAIAIAAQAITGQALGAGDRDGTRAITRRMITWGAACGVVTGLALAALSPFLGAFFTSDDASPRPAHAGAARRCDRPARRGRRLRPRRGAHRGRRRPLSGLGGSGRARGLRPGGAARGRPGWRGGADLGSPVGRAHGGPVRRADAPGQG